MYYHVMITAKYPPVEFIKDVDYMAEELGIPEYDPFLVTGFERATVFQNYVRKYGRYKKKFQEGLKEIIQKYGLHDVQLFEQYEDMDTWYEVKI